jgi:hypothetical protein
LLPVSVAVRMLQRLNIAVLPFTGTDVVQSSEELAQETVDFIVADMRRRWRIVDRLSDGPKRDPVGP